MQLCPWNQPLPTFYEQPGGRIIGLEDVRRFANLLRMSGEIYVETYPQLETAAEQTCLDDPPTNYFVFDGPRTLSAWGNELAIL